MLKTYVKHFIFRKNKAFYNCICCIYYVFHLYFFYIWVLNVRSMKWSSISDKVKLYLFYPKPVVEPHAPQILLVLTSSIGQKIIGYEIIWQFATLFSRKNYTLPTSFNIIIILWQRLEVKRSLFWYFSTLKLTFVTFFFLLSLTKISFLWNTIVWRRVIYYVEFFLPPLPLTPDSATPQNPTALKYFGWQIKAYL